MLSWVASELRFVEVPLSWRGWCRAGLAAQDVRIYQLRLMTISIHSSSRILNLKDGQFSRNKKQGEWTYVYIYIYVHVFLSLFVHSMIRHEPGRGKHHFMWCPFSFYRSGSQVMSPSTSPPWPVRSGWLGKYREIVDRERPTEFLQHNLSLWSPWKRFWSEFFETIILRSTSWCIISYAFVKFPSQTSVWERGQEDGARENRALGCFYRSSNAWRSSWCIFGIQFSQKAPVVQRAEKRERCISWEMKSIYEMYNYHLCCKCSIRAPYAK